MRRSAPVILAVLAVAVGARVLIRIGYRGYAVQPTPTTRPTAVASDVPAPLAGGRVPVLATQPWERGVRGQRNRQRGRAPAPRRALAEVVRVREPVAEPLLGTAAPALQNPTRGSSETRSRLVELRLVNDRYHTGERAVALVLEHFNPAGNIHLRPGRLVEVSVSEDDRGRLHHVDVIKPAVRFDTVVILAAALVILVLLVGQHQGLRVVVALAVCGWGALEWMRLIGATWPPVPTTIAFAVLVVVAALLLVTGPSRKSLSALAGVAIGVAVAAVAWFAFAGLMGFNGRQSAAARTLLDYARRGDLTFEFTGLAAAAVIVILLGLVLDVAIGVASAVWEVCAVPCFEPEPQSRRPVTCPTVSGPRRRTDGQAAGGATRRTAWLAGMAVGRDIGGTMVLTLVFAMLGALLPALLYPWAAGASAAEALNGEAGAMLITRALVCGIGMLVAVPATAACAAWLMPGHVRPVRRPARREWLIGRGLVGLEVVALILLLVGAPEGRPPATTGALELDRELEAIDTADRGLEAARDRLAEGRLDAAILTLWRAATRDPSRVLVQMQLGHAYSVRGWPAQATTAVERAAELDPGDGRIHQFLGRLYEGQGRHALAVEAFLRAAALNRDDVDVLCDLATAYSGVDDFDSAERITRRAAALAPTHPRVRQLLDALDIDRP